MREDSARLWWEEITGPSLLVRSIADELLQSCSVLLRVPADLPWRTQMRTAVESVLREHDNNLLVDYIDCAECAPDMDDIPGFLLSRYAPIEVQNGYRVSSGRTIHQYIAQNKVLCNRVIWVKGMTASHDRRWLEFCQKYRPKDYRNGLILVESYRRDEAGLASVRYEDYVSSYDALLFNSMTASAGRNAAASLEQKQYIAAAASRLCGRDVELSSVLLEEIELASECPIDALCRISQMPYFARRLEAETLDEGHPFALIRTGREEEMNTSLWRAQLQTLFPLLELERIALVDRYAPEIRAGLPMRYWDMERQTSYQIRQYNKPVEDPYDAEVGTLYRMNHVRQADDLSRYLLFLSGSGDKERLDLIYHMRNKLAHSKPCSVQEVWAFLDAYPYEWRRDE